MDKKIDRPEKMVAQELCIDLPGESVQCWRSSDNLKVVLKKHRDIIFDINLGDKKTYTVESTTSNFYSARDKKLISPRQGTGISFVDGERMHLWVARNFLGELLLKCDGILLAKLEPNKIDSVKYDDSPKTKPAPLIFAIGSKENGQDSSPALRKKNTAAPAALPSLSAAPVDDECSVICVVEGSIKNAPEKFAGYFKKVSERSVLIDFDPYDIVTKSWIWSQVIGSTAYVADNWEWLRASIDGKTHKGLQLVSAKIHYVNGKVRFYYSGYSKFNTVFGSGGFGPGHDRVMNIFAGVGKTSSAFSSMASGVAGTLKKNALIAFIFTSAMSISEWKSDVRKDGHDLAANLFIGLLKTLIIGALVTAAVALAVVVVMVTFKASMTVLMVGALTLVIGIPITLAVDAADVGLAAWLSGGDSRVKNMGDIVAPHLRKATERAINNWNYLVKKYVFDYKEVVF